MAIGVAIVMMRIIGVDYFHNKGGLGWSRKRPRWGVAWKL
jgi:hypothetical protein